MSSLRRFILLALAWTLAATAGASAQVQSGSLYGTTVDEQGNLLPGATVTLSGNGAPQSQVASDGTFRFLNLSPGTYSLRTELDGFSPVEYPSVSVSIGRSTDLQVTLSSAITDVITVTSEQPLLDPTPGKVTSFTQTELEKIPTARDPWAILQSTPGVRTDRINVGGNESGQQSQYVGPGSTGDQAVWALDGMVITDMSATGSSPGYYDFDSFEEMQVTTGGADASVSTPGVVLNMVTKRGTNEWRGSARYLLADKGSQSDLSFDVADLGAAGAWNTTSTSRTDVGGPHAQSAFRQGNRIESVIDSGLELGGPIVRDRFWVWGSYAKPEIDLRTIDGFTDFTSLEGWNLKLNANFSRSNSATVFAWESDKVKLGRNAGPTRPQETTWDQSGFGDSPAAYKVEDSHVFSNSFYLLGRYSKVNGGFQLVPEGGDKMPFLDFNGVWHNSFFLAQIERPQEQFVLDGSTLLGSNSRHELKFGLGYREAEQTSLSNTQGGGYEQELGGGTSLYAVARDGFIKAKGEYTSAFVQDTVSLGNLTVNLGLNYSKQTGANLDSQVSANRFLPADLPAISFQGAAANFEWEDLTPRLGLTYSLGAERKTLLRASLSRFADQLGTGVVAYDNPIGVQSYLYFYGPTRGNSTLPSAADLSFGFTSGNYDSRNGGVVFTNGIDPDLSAPLTDELLLSVEHALRPEFSLGLNLTLRQRSNELEYERLVFDCAGSDQSCAFSDANLGRLGRLHRADDYVLVTSSTRTVRVNGVSQVVPRLLPDGTPYTLTYYELRPGVSTRSGLLLENGDREQDYLGAALTFTKRLSNRWMLRGNVTWQDWTWSSPDSENEDPTRQLPGLPGSALNDGEPVIQGSGTGSGAKGQVYLQANWSYTVNGLYQVAPDRPWGFNVAASLTGRQGYPAIYYERFFRSTIVDSALGATVLAGAEVDDFRNPDVQVLDLRLEKEFSFRDVGVTVGADLFNATNESTVLQRNGRLTRNNSDHVQEILSPRIFRLGVKLSLR